MNLPPGTPERLALVRIVLSIAGFVAALAAVALENGPAAWAAIALLGGSLVVRLVERRTKGH